MPNEIFSATYHYHEAGTGLPRARALRGEAFSGNGEDMIPQRNDVLTCILVVTAALLVAIAKCSRCVPWDD